MSHVQSPIDRPARCTKAELSVQVETLKRRVAELEETAADRIRVADALRMSEARLRAIMDHAPTEIFLVDGEGRYVLINKEFERRYGLTEEQVIGKTMGEFFPADITAEFTAQDRETFETGRAMVKEQVIEYGGVVHTDLEIKFPIIDLAGRTVGVGGIATDITDRKKAEAALQQAHDELEHRVAERTAELAAAQRLAKIGNWRWSVGRDALISCSEEYARIHGVGMDEIEDWMRSCMTRAIHPDDRDRVQSEFKRFDVEGIDYEIEYRIVRPDGEVRHVLELGEAVRDAAGEAIEHIGTVQDVTELKRVEEALREAHDELELRVEERTAELHEVNEALRKSESRYRALFENAPISIRVEDLSEVKARVDALGIDHAGDVADYLDRHPALVAECGRVIKLTDVNRAGLTLHDVEDKAEYLASFNRDLSDEALETFKNVLLAIHRGETNLEFETFVTRADGSRRDVEAHWSVVPGYEDDYSRVLFISVDITARKRAEEALRESEAMLAKAQRIGELGFSIWDEKEGREVYCSRPGAEIFGVPEGTLCDDFEDFLERVHPEDRARVEAAMERGYEDHGGYEVEYKIVRPDGTTRSVVERTECEFDDEGKLARTVSTLQDITERKRVEDEMHRYRAELAHVSRLNMLGEMTAGLAHELNQPLAVISSYAQGCLSSIEDGKDTPETLTGALQHIVSQSARASEIIRRIRGFIRKDRRRKSRIEVNAAIGVAIELLKGEIGANGVAIHMDLAEPPPTAVVDDIELQQVILNLARNSIEMMVSQGLGSRELCIRTAVKTPSLGDGVGQIEISVQDTGPGVPPEIRDHIFEPFFTTKPQGLGLGLSICRSIIDRHDGNLWLAGDGGTGADFRFTLPLCAREGPSDV